MLGGLQKLTVHLEKFPRHAKNRVSIRPFPVRTSRSSDASGLTKASELQHRLAHSEVRMQTTALSATLAAPPGEVSPTNPVRDEGLDRTSRYEIGSNTLVIDDVCKF